MTYRPPGTLGVLRILATTSLLRLLRAARIRRAQRAQRRGTRSATPRKSGDGLVLLMLAMLPIFALNSLMVTGQAVQRLSQAAQAQSADGDTLVVSGSVWIRLRQTTPASTDDEILEQLARASVGDGDRPSRREILEHFRQHGIDGFRVSTIKPRLLLDAAGLDAGATRSLAAAASLILVAIGLLLLALAFGAADANLAGGAWTQAWLMTFPVTTRSLVVARALEYSLVQLFPWLVLFPFLLQLLLATAQPGAVWLAMGATVATTTLTGSIRLWLETWLRLRFSLRALRSIQAACTLLALLLLTAVFGICLGERVPGWFMDLAQAAPNWLVSLPAAWPMALTTQGVAAALPGVLATLVALLLACLGAERLLSHGAMTAHGVDPGQRGGGRLWETSARRLGVVGKDLAMLRRDRTFLVQTLIVPLFVIGLQILINPGLGRVEGQGIAMLAYGIGLYSLIGGCFQVLSAEGRALWMLYSLPVPIADVLRRKTRIWAGTAVGLALGALLVFALRQGSLDLPRLLADVLCVGGGAWCAAHVAAGISILGTDPAADHVPRQPKARHVYLYFFFAGTYMMGLQSADLAVRAAALLVFATLAVAVWQRACDRVPWLLDPVDEKRTSIGVYDGAVAMVVFFALQALVLVLAAQAGGWSLPTLPLLLVAFTIAGTITLVVSLLLLAQRGVALRQDLGFAAPSPRRAASAVLLGAVSGTGAAVFGIGYVRAMRATGWIELPAATGEVGPALVLVSVVAAPIVEEILFRGLVFQGLLRGVRLPLAVLWSAALFAAMHPAPAWPPVVVVGVLTALVFHVTRFLPAAMAVHAVYNAIVVVLQP